MFDAIGFHYIRRRKKKSKHYIIPPHFLKNANSGLITEVTDTKIVSPVVEVVDVITHPVTISVEIVSEEVVEVEPLEEKEVKPVLTKKVSALSLSSIRSKKELEASLQKKVINLENLPKDPFTMEDMMEHWNYYSNRLNQSGLMLMCSLMGMCQPNLQGSFVTIELPNEGSKLSFDENKYELVNFLRKRLNNYDLEINIVVNEQITIKRAFTPEDKYKHLNQINPALEMLVRTFELDITKM